MNASNILEVKKYQLKKGVGLGIYEHHTKYLLTHCCISYHIEKRSIEVCCTSLLVYLL